MICTSKPKMQKAWEKKVHYGLLCWLEKNIIIHRKEFLITWDLLEFFFYRNYFLFYWEKILYSGYKTWKKYFYRKKYYFTGRLNCRHNLFSAFDDFKALDCDMKCIERYFYSLSFLLNMFFTPTSTTSVFLTSFDISSTPPRPPPPPQKKKLSLIIWMTPQIFWLTYYCAESYVYVINIT